MEFRYAAFGYGGMIFAIVSAIVIVLELMAVSGLFKRTKQGWRLVFYASLVNLVGSLVVSNIVGGILGAVIGWYLLFQVKELYRN